MGHKVKDRRDGALAFGIFALLFSVYLLTFSGVYHASDEMSMLAVADSLARRGAWDIESLHWMGEQQGSFGPDGHLYGRKGIGTTLVALPHYWLALQAERLGNVQTAMMTNAAGHALTGMLVFLLLRQLRYGRPVALGTALAFGLATMAWPYARYLFSESLAALGLMLCAYFLVLYGSRPLPSDPELRGTEGGWRLLPLLAGAGLALAMLARLNNAIVAPIMGLLLLFYLYRRSGANWRYWIGPIFQFVLPVLAALAIAAGYNWLRFDDLLNTGYLPQERFATPFLEGFYGLTFSPGKGLFWFNPILLAALVAWPVFFRQHRAEALMAGAVVLVNIAFYSPWFLWWAGHGWGPRFLVTIMPFAALSLAPPLEAAARRRALAVGLAVLAVISVAVQLLGVAVNFNQYLEDIYSELGLYHPATLFDAAYSPLVRQWMYLKPENLDLAWARGGSLDGVALSVGLGLVLASGLVLWAAWHGRVGVWARAGLLALLVLGAGFSLLRYAPTGDVAQAASNLAAMERPGEAAALTEPLLTEPFQDAYDGRLWVWGVSSKEEIAGEHSAVWTIGAGDSDPATARFQAGEVRADYFSPPGWQFDTARLPLLPAQDAPNLGNVVELVALHLDETRVKPGETLSLALYWRALAPTDTSYTVFVQAVDKVGVKAGQLDRLPCDGGCPTTTWRPGDLVGERYDLPIRADAPHGPYQVIVGMYDLATGDRLSLLDAQGNAVADHLLLGTVEVQP